MGGKKEGPKWLGRIHRLLDFSKMPSETPRQYAAYNLLPPTNICDPAHKHKRISMSAEYALLVVLLHSGVCAKYRYTYALVFH